MFNNLFGFGEKKRKRTLTSADKNRIAAKQDWRCKKCGKLLNPGFHVDHKKRFSEGGSNSTSNLQALCPNCHSNKTEQERHRIKQKKIKNNERPKDYFNDFILGSSNTKKKSNSSYENLIFGKTTKKKGKNKKNNPFDFF